MSNTKKPAFNADVAEEYFSDLLVFYRNTANDIFRRDNNGRHASNQIYSAEYQKYVGMQIAMREVLEYFSKFDLCEWIADTPCDRLRELVDADKEGRCEIFPCKNGDTVWYITPQREICEAKIIGIWLNIHTNPQLWIEITYFSELTGQGDFKSRIDLILGKNVFLAREAAQAALEGDYHAEAD